MNKKIRICKLGMKISNSVMIVQAVVFAFLFFAVNTAVTGNTRNTAINNMKTAAIDRSEIIENYIASTEDTLTAYLKAEQIYDLLRDPENPENVAAAQEYTERFGKDLTNLEGIYASSWDTNMLTHTNAGVVGKITRPDEAKRKQLHDAILATQGVYNTGIIISPATGEQIISMYKAVRENDGTHIGLGGIGIFTSGLVDKLNALPLDGLEDAQYFLVNANTGEYIFHPNSEKITTVAEEQYIKDIISAVSGKDTDVCGYLEYKNENGADTIATYNSMSKEDWVFILSEESAKVLGQNNSFRVWLIILCLISLLVLSALVYFTVRKLVRPMQDIEGAVTALGNLDLNSVKSMDKIAQRKDEIGSVAESVVVLCASLKNAVNDINRVLGEMANENFAVDVRQNSQYYVGDFSLLLNSLETIKERLSSVISDIYVAAEQVNTGSGQLAAGAQTLSHGTVEQTVSIDELAKNLETIEDQVNSNSENCDEAHKLMNDTSDYLNDVTAKMNSLTEAMDNINSTSDKISNIIKTIEDIAFQTNILALNAAVEAARAGDAGKGFAVVADEVRNLASKSAEAVSDTTKLIESSVEAVNSGSEITKQTSEAVNTLSGNALALKRIVENIAESGRKQADMVGKINSDISKISGVVQSNSAAAEESAAASEELSGQANMLKDLIGRFNV